jgi:hypothetical protein
MRSKLLATAAFVAAGVVTPAFAGDPAVSALNFKVTAQGGQVDDEDAWRGIAAVTAPMGHAWGLQGEVGAAGVNGDTAWGLAGHVFMRDPSRYLVGAFGAYANADSINVDVGRIGLEGEYYLETISIIANAGYQFGDSFIDDAGFGEIGINWYANDDFALSGGVSFVDDSAVTRVGAEWLVGGGSELSGLALRGDLAFGDNSYDSVLLGITYYFGPDASLKDRHRKQDPESALFDLLTAVEAACETPTLVLTKAAPYYMPPTTSCGVPLPYYPE